jgi:nucleotide-binding universal stress UspA family protein
MARLLVATDLSSAADTALDSAAAWAAAAEADLHVVHVVRERAADHGEPERLAGRSAALQATGRAVTTEVLRGTPVDAILRSAREVDAELIVLGAAGATALVPWGVGGVAEGVAVRSPVPVLAVRGGLLPWLRKERALQVVVGVDDSTAAAAAVRWALALRRMGPCDVALMHAYTDDDLAHHSARLALRGDVPGKEDVLAVLRRDLAARIAPEHLPIVFRETASTPARGLAALATERAADLLVIGAPRHSRFDRVVRGSTVHGLLARTPTSLALVPNDAGRIRPAAKRVLVPIDFSPSSQGALLYARSLLGDGGALVILHVAEIHYDTPPEQASRHRALEQRLRALVPPEHGIEVEARVVEEFDPGRAIVAAAEREGVDAICMSTRENSLAKAFLGSVANAVVGSSHVPVYVIPPDVGQ